MAGFVLLAVVPWACGGGSSVTTAPKQAGGAGSTGAKTKEQEEAAASLRNFGHEASSSEAGQIESAMHAYLDARVGGEWSEACSYLMASLRHVAAEASSQQGNGGGCAETMATSTKQLSSFERAALAEVEVTAVRVKGDQAYVFYKESGAGLRARSMKREGGHWKVGGTVGFSARSPRQEGSAG